MEAPEKEVEMEVIERKEKRSPCFPPSLPPSLPLKVLIERKSKRRME